MVNVVKLDLPVRVKSFVVESPEGDYTVALNARLSAESQEKCYRHEVEHLERDDFRGDSADVIEKNAHTSQGGTDYDVWKMAGGTASGS